MSGNHLRRRVLMILPLTTDHLRENKTGGKMDWSHFRTFLTSVLSEAIPTPSIVELLLHPLLALDPFFWVKVKIPIKHHTRIVVPPRGVKHNVHRQHAVFQSRIFSILRSVRVLHRRPPVAPPVYYNKLLL